MTGDDLERAQKTLNRHSLVNIIYPDYCSGIQIICRTTASSIFIKLTRKDILVFWDLRFIEYTKHAFWAVSHFREYLPVGGRRTTGAYHLESVIFCRLAELSLNPGSPDYLFAYGILTHSSLYFHQSMPSLKLHSDTLDVDDKDFSRDAGLFESFILEHELAHNTIKREKKADYLHKKGYMKKMAAVKLLLDNKHAQLKARGDANPWIPEMYAGLDMVYHNPMLFEEIIADTYAANALLTHESNVAKTVPASIITWMLARALLTGISALRLLGISDILAKAGTLEEFDRRLTSHRHLYYTRKLFMEGFFAVHIMETPDDSNGAIIDEQLERLTKFSYEQFDIALTAEFEIRRHFTDGLFDMIRQDAKETQQNHSYTDNDLLYKSIERLGWLQFYAQAEQKVGH